MLVRISEQHRIELTTSRTVALRETAAYRERNKVERLINRLRQYRRIATRYEKRAPITSPATLGMTMLLLT